LGPTWQGRRTTSVQRIWVWQISSAIFLSFGSLENAVKHCRNGHHMEINAFGIFCCLPCLTGRGKGTHHHGSEVLKQARDLFGGRQSSRSLTRRWPSTVAAVSCQWQLQIDPIVFQDNSHDPEKTLKSDKSRQLNDVMGGAEETVYPSKLQLSQDRCN
jgi:hypothetical protein